MEGTPKEPPKQGEQRDAGPGADAPSAAQLGERIEGLRTWLARIDRKLGARSYLGVALFVLALAAAIVAVVLALGAKEDSASKADLENLREEVAGIEAQASQAAEEEAKTVDERLSDLEQRISELSDEGSSTERELSVVQDDIQDLRDQISDLESAQGSAGGQTGP
jgi:septal ring factor EnvC (AmiA/AmiB activator)